MAEAIIIYKNIPGIEGIDSRIFRNPQFAKRMYFGVLRRLILKAKKLEYGNGVKIYEFTVNGIIYHAKLVRELEPWEKAYYKNSRRTRMCELMNVYP